jgi:pimeloyl-ACP methyl ester carboxylesterase
LTDKRIRRGIFQDVEQLILAIGGYIDRHNENTKPRNQETEKAPRTLRT